MTVLYLYYNQAKAIKHLESVGYPGEFEFMFVDDGSKEPLKCDWATVLRIEKDIAWNQPQANNLAFKTLKKGYVLRMDLDHWFTLEDLQKISDIRLEHKQIMFFSRIQNSKPIRRHPNIFLCRVEDILNAGGYNEYYCGNYGYDDKELMRRLKHKGFRFLYSDIDCNVEQFGVKLKRDTTINKRRYEESDLQRHNR